MPATQSAPTGEPSAGTPSGTSSQGLTTEEARSRVAKVGPNSMPAAPDDREPGVGLFGSAHVLFCPVLVLHESFGRRQSLRTLTTQ